MTRRAIAWGIAAAVICWAGVVELAATDPGLLLGLPLIGTAAWVQIPADW